MTETFAALLLAHVVADFLLQTKTMVLRKKEPQILLLHGIVVLLTAWIALGRIDAWEVIALAAAHLSIDALKVYALPDRLSTFLADQAAHIATLLAVAVWAPGLFEGGLWGGLDWAPAAMALTAGFITATMAGGYAVALLVSPWSEAHALPAGLPNGGRLIGLLERGIIFMLIVAGQPAGIGFLIAAKSVLRFETTSKDQSAGEYVIVGTLASFGWAMAVTWATVALLSHLPPLGIASGTP